MTGAPGHGRQHGERLGQHRGHADTGGTDHWSVRLGSWDCGACPLSGREHQNMWENHGQPQQTVACSPIVSEAPVELIVFGGHHKCGRYTAVWPPPPKLDPLPLPPLLELPDSVVMRDGPKVLCVHVPSAR